MKKLITLFILLTVLFLFTTAKAQIPNPSFENWSTVGSYVMPAGWDNLNPLTSVAGVYTCEKGTTSPSHGAYYLELKTKVIAGDTIPGVAVCGKIDVMSKAPKSGFAFTSRPASFTGKYQYMPGAVTDTGYVAVWLTKWNTTAGKRDTIASKINKLTTNATSWTAFNVALNYASGNFPDSAIIGLSASSLKPAPGSYLYVDSVNFSGNVASVPGTTRIKHDVKIYPNPASDRVLIDFGATLNNDAQILVMDLFGRVKTNATQHAGNKVYDADVSKFAAGIYYVTVQVGDDIQTQKLVIR